MFPNLYFRFKCKSGNGNTPNRKFLYACFITMQPTISLPYCGVLLLSYSWRKPLPLSFGSVALGIVLGKVTSSPEAIIFLIFHFRMILPESIFNVFMCKSQQRIDEQRINGPAFDTVIIPKFFKQCDHFAVIGGMRIVNIITSHIQLDEIDLIFANFTGKIIEMLFDCGSSVCIENKILNLVRFSIRSILYHSFLLSNIFGRRKWLLWSFCGIFPNATDLNFISRKYPGNIPEFVLS